MLDEYAMLRNDREEEKRRMKVSFSCTNCIPSYQLIRLTRLPQAWGCVFLADNLVLNIQVYNHLASFNSTFGVYRIRRSFMNRQMLPNRKQHSLQGQALLDQLARRRQLVLVLMGQMELLIDDYLWMLIKMVRGPLTKMEDGRAWGLQLPWKRMLARAFQEVSLYQVHHEDEWDEDIYRLRCFSFQLLLLV